ncbi:antibiotic biosynthesis monooxygenase family protein [Phycicoccus flavus]|uniref:antibiotic biosynthesis monooxygenase family protein n=1 Tax=Phycicoccus flavus TaxID=2502783 RepID=UPI000FEBC08C|nr:antibiotic biosynthesis monooxygenase family protein [Phycicoccus flavus]NHA69909.1 antibiotic biosynthesis monooxygenase [Phycicoccus flavus]
MSTTSSELHGTSRITIHSGRLEEFKRLAARCVDIVRHQDTGTIEYNLFLNEEGTECFVHERYRDSAAGLEHMQNIAEVSSLLSEVCTMTGEVCGEPSPGLRQALEAAGVTVYSPLASSRVTDG